MRSDEQIDIFIVDDNKIFALVLKMHIETSFGNRNLKVSYFETGEKCIANFDLIRPKLIILDFALNTRSPDAVDGLQVLDKIKSLDHETSFIMLTSNEHIDIALRSFDQGASAYVVKAEDQYEKIDEAIERIFAKKEKQYQNEEKGKRNAEELIVTKNLREEAEKSKFIVEEKNKSLTDSINYAKRIQQAKLPRLSEIQAFLPESFILFKPKDIVSGDFYFFSKNKSGVFLVAADCTGHGVPGAFMSMIGSEKLDDAVAHSSDTSEILKHLNIGIKNSLHQTESGESTRDGMDIAICSIDIENRMINYSGANRPLWIMRKGELLIEEIKGTKKAIGGLTDDDQHFETHKVQLKEGDTFYIATDGYADQFGGNNERKLMTKNFKIILESIQGKSMVDQERHLDDFVENWKGETEQVDDILVIGVRL